MGGILKAQTLPGVEGGKEELCLGPGRAAGTLGDGQAGDDVLSPCTSAWSCDSFVFKHLILLRSIYMFLYLQWVYKLIFLEKPLQYLCWS